MATGMGMYFLSVGVKLVIVTIPLDVSRTVCVRSNLTKFLIKVSVPDMIHCESKGAVADIYPLVIFSLPVYNVIMEGMAFLVVHIE